MNNLAAHVLPQIDELLSNYRNMRARSQYDDLSDLNNEGLEFVTSSLAAIHRAAGDSSQYAKLADKAVAQLSGRHHLAAIPSLLGTLKALRHAIVSGYLGTIEELIHADLFADFLEMAGYLLEQGYKDPAAVLVGGVLEEHLRKLCLKHNLSKDFTNAKGQTEPKKADAMNSDLAKANVYTKLDQKNVTSWLDLRNKAAHGHYDQYTKEQVDLFLQSVTDFMARHPA